MRRFLILLPVLIAVFSPALLYAQASPATISLSPVGPQYICNTGKDTLYYSLSASNIPPNTNVVIYQGADSLFNPYLGQGDSIAFVPGQSIPKDTLNFSGCVKIIGEFIDACGPSGQEGRNEYIILTSGNGFQVNNLGIDFSSQNNSGNNNHDININAVPCLYKTPDPVLITNLRQGSCNASNVIPASPGDSIPPSAIVVVFTSDSVNALYSLNGLCNTGYPVYILQSACIRSIGAFTNAPRCDAPSRYRTTLAVDQGKNCSSSFTYDLCDIFNKDGTYAIRQAGIDTASVANNGIRRNTIDSCGGIDFTQLSFNSDTILKYPLQNQLVSCNTLYFLKAITHPNGQQPVSNSISFELVCVDVNAQARDNTICSGEKTDIGISSTNPDATFSWNVVPGANISGASAGTGNTINQVLINTGNQTDSVNYFIFASDNNCTAIKTVTVFVQPLPKPVISGNLTVCSGGNTTLSVQQGFSSYSWSTGAQVNSIIVTNPGKYVVTVTEGSCSGKDSVIVIAGQGPQPDISGELSFCDGGSTNLIVIGQFDSLRWNTNATSPSITVNQAGTYSVTAYSGGCSASDTVEVVSGQVSVRISGDTIVCNGAQTTLTAVGGLFDSVRWSTNQTIIAINVFEPGTYSVTVYRDGCSGFASVDVSSINVPVEITGNLGFCPNQSTNLFANGLFDSIRWNTGEITYDITVLQPGIYSVTVYVNGCSGTDAVTVTQLSPPAAFSLGNDTSYCGEFSRILSTGDQSTVWSTGVTAAQITVSELGTYYATISNACGTVSDTILVGQNEVPQIDIGNDTTICEGEIILEVAPDYVSYAWSTGSELPAIIVTEPGTYSVTVAARNGCEASDSINIALDCPNSLFIPNAFSPNNDEVNDVFYVRGNPRNMSIEKMSIYNRWGENVFEASDILPDDSQLGWDGSYKGKPAPKDSYGYLVIVRFANGEEASYTGNITLLR